jgi:DNA-binding beta-propeller fold protein YncE
MSAVLQPGAFRGTFVRKIGSTDKGPGQLGCASGVCYAPDGRLFVSDYQNAIHMFRADGSFERKFGSEEKGDEPMDPTGMCISPEDFVADDNNSCVQVFSLAGVFNRKFGSEGSGAGQLQEPLGVAISPAGEVFVSEGEGHRISVFSKEGHFLRTFGTHGSGDGQLEHPEGIAFSASGELFVADCDNHRVQVFSAEGAFKRKFGTQGTGDGQLSGPIGLSVSAAGDVFVVHNGNHRLQQFGLDGSFKRVVSSGQQGAGDTDLDDPFGVAVGPAGEVAVADFGNHRVVVWCLELPTDALSRVEASLGVKMSFVENYADEPRRKRVTPLRKHVEASSPGGEALCGSPAPAMADAAVRGPSGARCALPRRTAPPPPHSAHDGAHARASRVRPRWQCALLRAPTCAPSV